MPAMQYESEYCIDVGNRFAGLDFEDDPLELIQQAQQKGKTLKAEKKQKGGKQSAKPQEKVQTFTTKETVVEDVKKEGPKGDKPERQDRGEQRGRGRGGRGRGRGRGRGAGGDRPPREGRGDFGDRKEGNDQQDDGEHKPFGGERRGGFGGERRGGFGGERRGFGGERRGGFGGERRGFGDRQGFGGDRQADRQGFGDKQGFGERKGFGNDSESSGERKGFGGGFGEQGDQQEDGFGRRGGRGFSRPRGRGRGRGGRGREFDRHSGSDRSYPSSSVKATEKREGSGAFNWGTPQDELEASEEANGVTQMDDEVKGSWADAAEQSEQQETIEGAGEGDPSIPKEEEAKEMTLDEYKSMMEKEKLQTTYRVRQANEGEKSFPKNAVTVRKLTEDEQEQDGSLYFPRRIIEEKIKTSGREKNFLQFDLKYAAMDSRLTSGNTGGRGNRRGGRGGRVGRGGSRRGGREGSDRHEERMSGGFGEKEPAVVEHYDEDFPNLQ